MRHLLLVFLWFMQWAPVAGQRPPPPAPNRQLRQVRVLAGGYGNRADGSGDRARFYWPCDVALGPNGVLYVADTENHCIRLVSPTGQVSTLAGSAGEGYADGPAGTARFRRPTGIAVDAAGVVYVADTHNQCVRRITPDGRVSTLAGAAGKEGNVDGPDSTARFARPGGLALDIAGTLYVADAQNGRVCTISPTGQVRTLARRPDSYEETPAMAQVGTPMDLDVDRAGNVYVADESCNCVLRISPQGQVRTLAGSATFPPAPSAPLLPVFDRPAGIVVDGAGGVYVTNAGTRQVLRATPDGQVRVWAGAFQYSYSPPSHAADGPRETARFQFPTGFPAGLALAPDGALYVADAGNHRIRRVSPNGQVSTVAGTGETTLLNGRGSAARFKFPAAIALAADGTAYVADTDNHCIRKITPAGQVTTLAGTGQPGFANGAGNVARFRSPAAVAVDRQGVVYVTERDNHCVRRIAPDGRVTTLAGTRQQGFANGPGPAARFRRPHGLALTPDGTLYVADAGNERVRRIQPNGQVSTLAGPRTRTVRPDGSPGIGEPFALALAANGTLYVGSVDYVSYDEAPANVLYAVTPAGRARFVAGGYSGKWPQDGAGTYASFGEISGLAVDGRGRVYVAESNMQQIRLVTPTGKVTTAASANGPYDFPLNPPMELDGPSGIATGPGGTLYVTNAGSNRILVLK